MRAGYTDCRGNAEVLADFFANHGIGLLADLVVCTAGMIALRVHRSHREHAAALGVSWPFGLIVFGLLAMSSLHVVQAVASVASFAATEADASLWRSVALHENWSRANGLVAFLCIGIGIDRIVPHVLPTSRRWFERLERARAHLAYEVENRRKAEQRLRASRRAPERGISERIVDLSRTNRSLADEVDRQRQLARQLEERVRFEELIACVSAKLVCSRAGAAPAVVAEVLKEVGESAGFDLVSIVELGEVPARFRCLAEWREGGIETDARLLDDAAREGFERCIDRLQQGETLYFEDSGAVDPALEPHRRCLQARGIVSAAGVPLLVGGKLHGCLILARTRTAYSWSEERVRRLTLIAELLATSIHRSRVEMDLARQVDNYSAIFHSVSDAIFIHDAESGAILDVNQKMCEMWEYPHARVRQMTIGELSSPEPGFSQDNALALIRSANSGLPQMFEWRARSATGRDFWVEVNLRAAEIAGDRVILALVRDVTERKAAEEQRSKLERQVVQSQRIEALGNLAGGVAHDFNNILTVILGNANVARAIAGRSASIDPDLIDCLEEIEFFSDRATALTQQLLAFGRRQLARPVVMDLHDALSAMDGMLRRLTAEDVRLVLDTDPRTPRILADPVQIEQIVLNLIVNGRDAMPMGGTITLETFGRRATEQDAELDCRPGDELTVLMVRDTGCGIEAESLEHIFEPFFTTKPVGQGTGLGLSTVHGVVKQLGGTIDVRSEVGKGTTFEIVLRACKAESQPACGEGRARVATANGETILVCEDDDNVRALTCRMLRSQGYVVHGAASGREAIELARTLDGRIDVLVTDVIMPEMNGAMLAREIESARPGTPVLFVSGYPADVLSPYGVMPDEVELLEKPFQSDELYERLRLLIDR